MYNLGKFIIFKQHTINGIKNGRIYDEYTQFFTSYRDGLKHGLELKNNHLRQLLTYWKNGKKDYYVQTDASGNICRIQQYKNNRPKYLIEMYPFNNIRPRVSLMRIFKDNSQIKVDINYNTDGMVTSLFNNEKNSINIFHSHRQHHNFADFVFAALYRDLRENYNARQSKGAASRYGLFRGNPEKYGTIFDYAKNNHLVAYINNKQYYPGYMIVDKSLAKSLTYRR